MAGSVFGKNRVMEKSIPDIRGAVTKAVLELAQTSAEPPVFMCIGTDKVTGDSLGPLVGHLLTKRHNVDAFVYGTLSAPITAKNLIFSHLFIRTMHPTSQLVAIDAALGAPGDVGLVKLYKGGIMPGSATNKNLPLVGDLGIMGVVNTSGMHDYMLLNSTRLNIVYEMAETIAAAVADALAVPRLRRTAV